jgi:hypothetical protein
MTSYRVTPASSAGSASATAPDAVDQPAACDRQASRAVGTAEGIPRRAAGGDAAAPVQPHASLTTMAARGSNRPSGTLLVSVGGGPRGETQAMAEMDLLRERRADFQRIQQLGGQYDIKTVIVERRGNEAVGQGNAWGAEHGLGTANTGVEGGSATPGSLLNYPERLRSFLQQNRNRLAIDVHGNLVHEALLARAFDGTFGPRNVAAIDCAVMTRAQVGAEAHGKFEQARVQTAQEFPFYKLEVKPHTSVETVDITNPAKPVLGLAHAATKEPLGELVADTVRLNTGTTLANPIRDPQVKAHAFVGAMDPQALKEFLDAKVLLDDSGQLKPGTRLALGGTSLSAYDELLALTAVMPLFEPDPQGPTGYKINEEAKEKYQGAITFVSSTPGQWVSPRHAHGPAWQQSAEPLGSAREQHAMFLHEQGQEIFKAWGVLTDASVALAQATVPKAARQEGLSTEQLLAAQHASTAQAASRLLDAKSLDGEAKQQAIAESTHTLEGARRQAHRSTIFGMGLERDPDGAVADMSAVAPNTFAGRARYIMERAQLKAITEPGSNVAGDNAALVRRVAAIMRDITASPFHVHDTAPLLFAAGIARYRSAPYRNFSAEGGERALTLSCDDGSHETFDAFIVSPTLHRGAEPALASLAGQAKPAHPQTPDHPEVGLNRQIVAASGEPSHVEDYSLNGRGVTLPGTSNLSNAFADDVSSRESAVEVAPGLALRRMAHEHLAAAGIEEPARIVEHLYRQLLPQDADHDREVARFAPAFERGMVKVESLKAAEVAAGDDGAAFAQLADAARSASSVRSHAALIDQRIALDARNHSEPVQRSLQASKSLADGLAARPAFNPASNADYQRRFVDVPTHIHEQVYLRALELAESRLRNAAAS